MSKYTIRPYFSLKTISWCAAIFKDGKRVRIITGWQTKLAAVEQAKETMRDLDPQLQRS